MDALKQLAINSALKSIMLIVFLDGVLLVLMAVDTLVFVLISALNLTHLSQHVLFSKENVLY